ncbi:MAG: malto-oligosyltrehalose trehalohydrolase [Chitinivibrionales bacterium]|nr:malto-oligosyltrehalose trehalohydrolase [Chitinivibrionales bacterium]
MQHIGAYLSKGECTFTVWAPLRSNVALHLHTPLDTVAPMSRDASGYWLCTVDNIRPGALYTFILDDDIQRPDPASHYQPQGVHGPSMVVDHAAFEWRDHTASLPKLDDYIIYELHVGAFTDAGTFTAAINRIPYLVELGVTAVEIMPVAQFPGRRNWGYDGVYPFAVQNSYGSIDELKALVDACHRHNLAVILDVVYNHLGPEGNYIRDYAPYFTDRYKTPWGESLNFDGEHSDGVCDYFVSNARYWLKHFHFDALRLDAVHAIADLGARPFLLRLSEAVEREFAAKERPRYLIAESDLNDTRVLRDREQLGFGLHAQWSDDFHHALHALLSGELRGYYGDFGNVEHLVTALQRCFVYAGDYSHFRKRRHGNDASRFHTGRFVVASQNHDQVGNRMLGERLIALTDAPRARLAAAAVLLSPYIPLLFMGEEHGEDRPFLYFVDHGDEHLKEAVRKGRRREFAGFHDAGELPDAFAEEALVLSKPDWSKQQRGASATMLDFYRSLIRIRTSCPAIGPAERRRVKATHYNATQAVKLYYEHDTEAAICLFNFGDSICEIAFETTVGWHKRFDAHTPPWHGAGNAVAPETLTCESRRVALNGYGCVVYCQQ